MQFTKFVLLSVLCMSVTMVGMEKKTTIPQKHLKAIQGLAWEGPRVEDYAFTCKINDTLVVLDSWMKKDTEDCFLKIGDTSYRFQSKPGADFWQLVRYRDISVLFIREDWFGEYSSEVLPAIKALLALKKKAGP